MVYLITRVGDVGATLIDCNVALLTVSEAVPVIPLNVAMILAVPADLPVARPEPLTVAIMPLIDDQVAAVVRSRVLPSLYMPTAVYCCCTPMGTVAVAGVTEI